MMKKIFLWIGYLLTFGALFFICKKKQQKNNGTKINLEKLVNCLGGLQNIEKLRASDSTVKFFLKDIHLVDLERLKKSYNKGTIVSNNNLTVLFGHESRIIADKLLEKLNNETNKHS